MPNYLPITDDQQLVDAMQEIRTEAVAEATAPSEIFALVLRIAARERIKLQELSH